MKKLFNHLKENLDTIYTNKYFYDLVIGFIFCVGSYMISVHFDLYEKWSLLASKYEEYEVDEIVFLLISIVITLAVFSYRRYKELKSLTSKLHSITIIDQLTGLKNRRGFLQLAEKSLKLAHLNSNTVSLIFIDLDRFKIINDTLGHDFGDIVLQHVSKRLINCIGSNDIICRHGGDEFIILLQDVTQKNLADICHNIINKFTLPFSIGSHEVFISPSIGISSYPTDGEKIEDLIKCADLAMYSAKAKGRNNFEFYTSTLSKSMCKKMHIENGLRKALENNEFVLYYQPQYNLETGEIVGVEALLRWNKSDLGLISPSEFIPVAEESGLIVPIGKWVLKTACKQNKIWQESGSPHINVAVNISPQQIKHPDFCKTVKQALSESELNPKFLDLEITESIMQNIEESTRVLSELKEIGVKVSIDDFGTGYSSLSILQYLPIDTLKIDQSFTNGVVNDSRISAIVQTIIDMGRNLKLCVIAEGIECEEQVNYLLKNKCFLGQGYFYSKPLPAKDISVLFEESYIIKEVDFKSS
ncbi:EAL domain-containing protein [Wukongibacter baidiensis]|uniref:putative bifunctional diguanylate cyclase/phosphodiesterase n=1 Tax=Wukongibacter baidiensis TaxID=1723361 RepID=UPI003D7F2F0F